MTASSDDCGGQLAAAQNVVADGELHVAVELVDALIDALVAAADEHHAIEFAPARGRALD